MAQHLELQRSIPQFVGQPEGFPHVETRLSPAAPGQVPDPREKRVDDEAATRIVLGQRHRRAKECLGKLEVRQVQRTQRTPGQDVGPERAIREIGGDLAQECVRTTQITGDRYVSAATKRRR